MKAPGRDHVSQVYLGLLDGGPTSDWLRRRIDWMAGEAMGPRVLDVGCSEGILELLLARRGIEVIGIDIDPDALEFARELLAKEPDEVRERVDLVHGDFLLPGQTGGPFDTVAIGEVLGYVDDPGAVLDRALEHLRPGGRVVVTTPFGVHPYENGRRTFLLTDMIDLLRPRLALEHLAIEDNHIRFVGVPSEESEVSWREMDTEAVLSTTDAALAASQKELYGMLAMRESRIERMQMRLREWVEVDRAARHTADTSRGEIKKLEFRVKLDRMALAQLKKQAGARTRELRARTREARDRTRELQATRRQLQTTIASTSFRVGVAIVSAAKRPLTLWKLPFELLRLYRSKSVPKNEATVSERPFSQQPQAPEAPHAISAEPYIDPDNPFVDLTKFIDFPVLSVPVAGSGRPTVAAILDTFSEYSLRHEVDLVLVSPKSWRAQMERRRPVCLFVESAWRGNNGVWQNRIVGYEDLEDNLLREVLEYCSSAGIPTVFWNKEDPPHFDNFLGAAREFDFVFTSDEDCVPRYREALGHDRVYVLPFAAQPRLHNPSRDRGWPRYPVCFAGSWVSNRYPGRAETLRQLLDPSIHHGLHIFDRNLSRMDFGTDYRFPEEYSEAIRGTLTYDEMLTAYRCYDVMLNVNTITESPTMFARRVFESLACGTPVISSESVGMRRMLGEHVRVAGSEEETARHLQELLGDEEGRKREGHMAYRHVHEHHTYRHRMDEVFRRVGLQPLGLDQPPVSVLTPTMRPGNVAHCLENFRKQAYENKELVLILNNAEFDVDAIRRDVESIPNAQVIHVEGRTTLGDCLNRGVEAASGRYVAEMDDDDHYGERYLSDSLLAASFSDAEIVGKGAYYVYFVSTGTTALRETTPEHTFTSSVVAGNTVFVQTEAAREVLFAPLVRGEDTDFQRRALWAGCRIYSADRFNYLRVWDHQVSERSWKISDTEFREKCRDYTPGIDFERAMI